MSVQETHKNRSEEVEEVWALFAQEGKEMLDLVEEALLKLESNPDDAEQIAGLFRAMHSFKGMAHIMDLPVIESLAHHAEDLVALVRDEGVLLSGEMIDLLLEVLDRLRGMLDYVLAHRVDANASQVEALEARLKVMPADEPSTQPLPSTEDLLPPAELLAETPLPAKTFVDPTTDPTYVRIFLEMARDELSRLHVALDTLADGDEGGIREIKSMAEKMKHAAGRMGYERLEAVLDDLAAATEEPVETRLIRLKKMELVLFEELTLVPETTQLPASDDEGMAVDIAWLFRHWHAERVFADLTCLGEITDDLKQGIEQFLADSSSLVQSEQLANEAAYLLRAIYHSCLIETVARMVKQATGEWEQVSQEAQTSLETWTEDVHTLGRVETEIGAVLDQLQKMALALRVKPVAEILNPLPGLVQDVAQHQAKMVELNVTGADIELDYSLVDILVRLVRRLVWFAATQGIEQPAHRREAGKPATGQISVRVSKAEGCVQIVVADDGRGLDRQRILDRALSWAGRIATVSQRMNCLSG